LYPVTTTEPTGPDLSRRTLGALAAISLLALGLRVWNLDFGLPGVFNMDERPILDRALTFAKGDPNPHNFLYPTLYLYAIFAWEALYFVVGRGLGWFSSLAAFQNAFFVDASGHVLAARLLTALVGSATVPAAFLFGRRVGGSAVGLAAALLLAVAPLAVRDAHYVKLDVPVTLFATLALATLTRIAAEPEAAARWRTWAVAGLLAGLAISTHYYAAILAVPFAAVAAADVGRSGRWQTSAGLLMAAGLATIAGFVLGSPFFVLEPGVIVRDFTELRQVDIDGKATYLSTIAVRLSATGSGHLVLYPNPAGDHVFIRMGAAVLPGMVKLRLTDWLGRVFNAPFSTGGNGILLQTGGLPGGSYALTVYANGLQYAEKLVIAR